MLNVSLSSVMVLLNSYRCFVISLAVISCSLYFMSLSFIVDSGDVM